MLLVESGVVRKTIYVKRFAPDSGRLKHPCPVPHPVTR